MAAKKGKYGIIEYVTEEVVRQGHDVAQPDGLWRVAWMLQAWLGAMSGIPVTLHNIETLGREVEPEKNVGGFRNCGVRVGLRVCPPPQEVIPRLERLLSMLPIEPLEFYLSAPGFLGR